MVAKNNGGWKTCSRGHKYRGPGPCPICWPKGRKGRSEAARVEAELPARRLRSRAARPADEAKIRALVARWHRATAKGDLAALSRLVTADVVILLAGQPPIRGREEFDRQLAAALAQQRGPSAASIEQIRVAGDLAYCWAHLTMRACPGEAGEAPGHYGPTLSTFARQANGEWLLARDSNLVSLDS